MPDPQVQSYLEELPNEPGAASEWMEERVQAGAVAAQPRQSFTGASFAAQNSPEVMPTPPTFATSNRQAPVRNHETEALIEAARTRIAARTSTATMTGDRPGSGTPPMPAAERVGQPPSDTRKPPIYSGADRSSREGRSRTSEGGQPADPAGTARRRATPPQSKYTGILRYLMPGAIILGMVALGFLVAWLLKAWQASSTKQAEQQEQLNLSLDAPLVALSPESSSDPTSEAVLNNESGQKIIESWLAAKALAMGPEHSTEKLDQILADPKLTEWKNAAEESRQSNSYRKYKHTVKVSSVEQSKENPDQAKVTAEVSESTDTYDGDQIKDSKSDPELRVQYDLIRTDNKWRIQNWQVIQ
ncbi:IMS domain-containing protein [Kovacikia minuta CCNUW1]|uniref:ARC6/PARC6 family protein n=1 Tax=Kovacikia minuta TaxID=2931930 RepID=UPI001CCAFE96|nr:IMS domain-containing protein [Kovacikia minuta]UBF26987.1 IMS domain-containing protein [Kovacikia minuta CCNUW1]